ncbi:hypothetical protein [Xanthobacter tagetidis]|nr:hypothetical protein [Xanthobacter tagetidis]MBB6306617.1 hypothetical protein [Xanthobacter tagetidis]
MDASRLAPASAARALRALRGIGRRVARVALAAGLIAAAAAPAGAQSLQFLGTPPSAAPQAGPFAPPPSGPPRAIVPGGGAGAREPHAVLPPSPPGKAALGVFARFSPEGQAIPRGVVWRVFADRPEASGAFPLVAESTDAAPVFFLTPGGYIIHASYGLANTAQRIVLGPVSRREGFVLPAGGLRLEADVENKTISPQKVTFDIFEGSFLQGRTSTQPYYRGAGAGEVVLLPEGTYHVVSTYGDANAVVRADVSVQPGKLTDATMHHRAAQVMLKLVKVQGGEAQADTQWTVITPGGDTIKESIGAFPVFVLTEGDYAAIARNGGKNYSREFKVDAGHDQEVEVLVK